LNGARWRAARRTRGVSSLGRDRTSTPHIENEYWEQGNAKAGETQVAAKGAREQVARTEAAQQYRPRSEPPAPQVADAGAKTGTQEYWRGPKHHHDDPDEGARIAEARRSRGAASGEADAQSTLPYVGTAEASAASSPAPSVASVGYEGGGEVPSRVVISITVAARV
jgi:hypothetical protein